MHPNWNIFLTDSHILQQTTIYETCDDMAQRFIGFDMSWNDIFFGVLYVDGNIDQ